MITKEVLGRRLREERSRHALTLRDVEARAGLSSTHISEIERGRTSPTVGALIRIAHALKKDPSYFIEERELDDVCVTCQGDRPGRMIPSGARISGGTLEMLTGGVICGRIRSYELRLDPGGRAELGCLQEGQDVCLYCVEGKVHVRIGDLRGQMTSGYSIHGSLPSAPLIEADPLVPGRVVIIVDPREDCR